MSLSANKMAIEENQESQNNPVQANDLRRELTAPRWSVITFDQVAASNLSYDEAVKRLEELRAEKISGLCIITDEAAARFAK